MAARSTWAGGIMFAGFSIPVRVFTLLNSRKSGSFKMLDPTHKQPVKQILVDVDGTEVARADTLRGVEFPKGQFTALPDEALEMIENADRSTAVEVERFAPVATVPLELSLESYIVVPDEKVPGSEQPVQILWNGLHETESAAIIPDWCPRAGARPSTLIVRAIDDGLRGNLLPFAGELKGGLPSFQPQADETKAQTFAAVVAQQYTTDDFDLAAYADGYAERREAAIALALDGKVLDIPKPAEQPQAAAPDMMAMLQAQLAAAPAKAKPAKPKAKVAA